MFLFMMNPPCEIDPTYWDYMVTEGNQKVLYVHITQDIYEMLVSAMLFYCKLTRVLLNASLSHALLLQADESTAQLWL